MPLTRKPLVKTAAVTPDPAAALAKLTSASEEERWGAARTAADIPDSVQALQNALSQESVPRVREAMFTSLAQIRSRDAVEAILPFIRSDDSSVRRGALDALAGMGEVARPYLPALLRDPDPDVRILSCDLARGSSDQDAVKLLCSILDTESEANVCAAVVEVLSEIGSADALPALQRCQERFSAEDFLVFSIKTTADLLRVRQAQQSG